MKQKNIEDKLCESFFSENLSEAVSKIKDINAFGELRYDLSKLRPEDLIHIKAASDKPLIFTYRKGNHSNVERKDIYIKAIELSFKYIDLDIKDDAALIPELKEYLTNSSTQLVISFHDHLSCPSKEELQHIVTEATSYKADLIKIVCTLQTNEQLETLKSIQTENLNTICFSMGEFATQSRIQSLRNGGEFTYVSLGSDKHTAKGQLNSLDFQKAYSQYRGDEAIKLAVLGHPIAHSKSPKIFYDFFKEDCIKGVYDKIELKNIEEFDTLKEHYDGFNVTAPFKQSIIPFLDQLSEAAQAINAVNTVYKKDGLWMGDNTDYIGIIQSIKHTSILLHTIKSCLIIGAGGAAHAAAYAMKTLNIPCTIINRTASKAERLAEKFGFKSVKISNISMSDYQLIINTTAILPIKEPQLSINHLVLDAIYHHSPFDHILNNNSDFQYINGKIWLRAQAMASYHLFKKYFD